MDNSVQESYSKAFHPSLFSKDSTSDVSTESSTMSRCLTDTPVDGVTAINHITIRKLCDIEGSNLKNIRQDQAQALSNILKMEFYPLAINPEKH